MGPSRRPSSMDLGATERRRSSPTRATGDSAMADEEDIDQLAAEVIQAIRRYVTAEIWRQFGQQNQQEGTGERRAG